MQKSYLHEARFLDAFAKVFAIVEEKEEKVNQTNSYGISIECISKTIVASFPPIVIDRE